MRHFLMAIRAGDLGPAQAKSPALSFCQAFLDTLIESVSMRIIQLLAIPELSNCSDIPLSSYIRSKSATFFVQQLMEW
jgi:hypothetical protein